MGDEIAFRRLPDGRWKVSAPGRVVVVDGGADFDEMAALAALGMHVEGSPAESALPEEGADGLAIDEQDEVERPGDDDAD